MIVNDSLLEVILQQRHHVCIHFIEEMEGKWCREERFRGNRFHFLFGILNSLKIKLEGYVIGFLSRSINKEKGPTIKSKM